MDYKEATESIFSLKRYGPRELAPTKYLLEQLGNPQDKLKVILVGGSNGKGSTAAMLANILQASGYKVGLSVKPHLQSFTERIVINRKKISEQDVVKLISDASPIIDGMYHIMVNEDFKIRPPTFFEIRTALAIRYFAEQNVDYAVLEVGMGGKLDATNATDPILSVITEVSLEHTQILGSTMREIALDKAEISRENKTLVTGATSEEAFSAIKQVCEGKSASLIRITNDNFRIICSDLEGQTFNLNLNSTYDNLHMSLLGEYQIKNAAVAVATIENLDLNIPESAIRQGLANTVWPGRLEIVQRAPLVILDCAHNADAAKKLTSFLKTIAAGKKYFVVSISNGKNTEEMLNALSETADQFIFARHKVRNRAVPAEELAKLTAKPYEIIDDVRQATEKALKLAGKGDLVCVCGSLFAAGEARFIWHSEVNFQK